VVLLDCFQLPGKVQALDKGVLLSLKDILPKVLPKTGEEQLMLEELGHVFKALLFHIGLIGGSNVNDSCQLACSLLYASCTLRWSSSTVSLALCTRTAKLAQVVQADHFD
jgi:hypothetical protein